MPDLLAVDVLIFLTAAVDMWGRRQAVRAAAVLYLSIDPSLHAEHLVPFLNCRKHRECREFLQLWQTELFETASQRLDSAER